MVDPIRIPPISPLPGTEPSGGPTAPRAPAGPSFAEILKKSLDEVNQMQNRAGEMQVKYVTGEINNLHDVMIAVEEANLAFQATMQIRNKILEAYQELMRMQV
ncbi:flagellar hook-basal body complex protein FliE [bacterium]|nr:flagellar hook-basal body complex protein FliE [bacterium]